MADIMMADNDKKKDAAPEEEADVIPGLTVEARDERVHVWITPTFTIQHNGSVYAGAALSLEGFEIKESAGLKKNKNPRAYTLRLEIGSFVLEVPVKAVFEAETERDGDKTDLFAFRDVENGERDVLRRFIRAHLSGHVVTVDDVIRRQDMPTSMRNGGSRNGNGKVKAPSNHPIVRFIRGLFSLVITLAVVGAIALFGSMAIYERLTVVEAQFATVTAPGVELLTPVAGQMTVLGPVAGERVFAGQELVRVTSPHLEAELVRARGRVVSNNNAESRARLTAVEMEIAANTTTAPCDCLVLWSPEDGAWVQREGRVYTLARTAENDLRVEALVGMRQFNRLFRGQTAFIRWPEADIVTEGTIEHIALDGNRQARVGFPEWLREDESVVSVMIRVDMPIEPSLIGHPVDVFVRTEVPFWERVRSFTQPVTDDGSASE